MASEFIQYQKLFLSDMMFVFTCRAGFTSLGLLCVIQEMPRFQFDYAYVLSCMGIDYEQFFKEEIYYTEFRNSNYQIAVVRNMAGTLERIAAELKLGTHETIRWIFRVHSEGNCEMCQLSHALIKLQNSKCPTSHWKFISVLIQSPSVSISIPSHGFPWILPTPICFFPAPHGSAASGGLLMEAPSRSRFCGWHSAYMLHIYIIYRRLSWDGFWIKS